MNAGHYFEATEAHPDQSIACGTIDAAGYRVVWLKAESTGAVHGFLRTLGVYPNRVTPLKQGLQPTSADGLDYDLTTIDRTVNIPRNSHVCHAFTTEWKGRELVMKCKQCGAIIHDKPQNPGGYYSE
jgi:hypothetical protein